MFEPGNKLDLIAKVEWILNNSIQCNQIVKNAHIEFKNKYSSEVNYKQLINIYEESIEKNKNNKLPY